MAGDNGGGKYISLHRVLHVLHLPNTEEPFGKARGASTRSHNSPPSPLSLRVSEHRKARIKDTSA